MNKRLKVDRRWCSKCRMCATVTDKALRFDDTGYPAEIVYEGKELELVRIGVEKCPAHLLELV